MDLENPVWQMPNILDVDQAGFRGNSEPCAEKTPHPLAGTDILTGVDSQAKGKERKVSKRESSSSAPARDGVTGFLHESNDDLSRGDGTVTPSATEFRDTAPKTPKRGSKPDAKVLLSPKANGVFNAKTLLSPGKGTRDEPAVINDNEEEADDLNTPSLYDKTFRLEKRTDAPAKRRKTGNIVEDTDDEARKKQKFEVKGGSGVVSEFLKNEKQKDVDEINDGAGIAHAIDLTTDGDRITEGQHGSDGETRVLLGKLERPGGGSPYVMMNNVPFMKPGGIFKPSIRDSKWPSIPVRLVHETLILVRVVDPMRQRFGNLDASTAKAIVPLMENVPGIGFKVLVPVRKKIGDEREGDMVSQQAELLIRVFARKRDAKRIGTHLSQHSVWLRPCPAGMTEQYYNPHDPKSLVVSNATPVIGGASSVSSLTRTVEEIRSDVLNMFDSITRTEQLPEADQPTNVLTELLSHQKQALFFLKMREEDHTLPGKDGSEGFHLWKSRPAANGKLVHYNVITGTELSTRPPRMRGGILADMMGLGKTLSMLSLVVDSKIEAIEFSKLRPPVSENAHLEINSRATLLICPLSVVSNWETQIKDHISPRVLKYSIYHGKDRTSDLKELSDNDIIITSYHTVANELKRHRSPMFRIKWFRIILDEAHIIRNSAAGISIAACELFAERRWAVTGTPVQNRLDDLGSLIKFLRIRPFDEKGAFAQYILAPFKNADPDILPKLRLLVDSITLRRLKDNIDLPRRRDLIVRLNFSKEERELYKIFVADSKSKVQLLASGERMGGKSYAHILKSIMRLRLICAHGEELLSDEDRKLLEGLTKDKAIDLTEEDDDDEQEDALKLSPKQAFEMLELLRTSGIDDCPKCGDKITNRIDSDEEEVRADTDTIGHMTGCFQIICPRCFPEHEAEIGEMIARDIQEEIERLENEGYDDPEVSINTYNCPYCRTENVKLGHYKILQSEIDAHEAEKARIRKDPKLARQMGFYRGPHTKTLKLIEYLKKFESESYSLPNEAPIKSIVFSAWTSHLDLIQIALTAHNIKYTRLDGSMSRKSRTKAIYDFTNDPDICVILITIGAGGLGLNLTAGNKVFVMEPQFNPAAEQQAVDRVHRLGQAREVEIMRFIMHDSFEENILSQQKKKIELADLTVNRNKKMDKAEAAKAKLESLKSLFR